MLGAGFRACDVCDRVIDSELVCKSQWQSFGEIDLCEHCFNPEHKPVWVFLGGLADRITNLEQSKVDR